MILTNPSDIRTSKRAATDQSQTRASIGRLQCKGSAMDYRSSLLVAAFLRKST